jgi:hypothetical protein
MVRTYRARAIEVIKEIDRLGLGAADSPREQIMREVRARIELDLRSNKKAAAKQGPQASASEGKPGNKAKKQQPARVAGPAVVPYADAGKSAAASSVAPGPSEPEAPRSEPPSASEPAATTAPAVDTEAAQTEAAQTAAANADDKAAVAAQAALDDEAMDADSTTTVEPRRSNAAKEATP